jgi:GTPase SAR1 family protein
MWDTRYNVIIFWFIASFESLVVLFIKDAIGLIVMFDLTSEQSFLDVDYWLTQIKIHAYREDPDVILVGNKSDCEDTRVISRARAQELADKHSLSYIETSACTGENVKESIEMLLEKVVLRVEKNNEAMLPIRKWEGGTYRF